MDGLSQVEVSNPFVGYTMYGQILKLYDMIEVTFKSIHPASILLSIATVYSIFNEDRIVNECHSCHFTILYSYMYT